MSDLINTGLVLLDRDLGGSTDSVIRALAATVHCLLYTSPSPRD